MNSSWVNRTLLRDGPLGIFEQQNCSGLTAAQRGALNNPTIVLASLMIASQLFNLLIFRRWRNKDPYLLLHVFLAIVSLLIGVCGIFGVFARFFPYLNSTTAVVNKVGISAYQFLNVTFLLTLLSISIDRWLSVEFAVAYRNVVSVKKMYLTLPAIVAVSLILDMPGLSIFARNIHVFCDRSPEWNHSSSGGYAWQFVGGPFLLLLIFICQFRIFTIVLLMKLKIRHSRQVGSNGTEGRSNAVESAERIVITVAWTSVRASMIVLLSCIVMNINLIVGPAPFASNPTLMRINYLLPSIQHVFSPLVYLSFFRLFRKEAFRWCGRLYANCFSKHSPARRWGGRPGSSKLTTADLHSKRVACIPYILSFKARISLKHSNVLKHTTSYLNSFRADCVQKWN